MTHKTPSSGAGREGRIIFSGSWNRLVTVFTLICFALLWSGISASGKVPDDELECGVIRKNFKNKLNEMTDKITGGAAITQDYAPWHVTLLDEDDNTYSALCGGSILTKEFVITARHCFECNGYVSNSTCISDLMASGRVEERYTDSTMQIGLQCKDMGKGFGFSCTTYFGAAEIFIKRDDIHPNHATYYHDTALVKLDKPIDYVIHNAAPICLPDKELEAKFRKYVKEQRSCGVTGTGIDALSAVGALKQLKRAKVSIYEARHCKNIANNLKNQERRDLFRMFDREYMCVKPNRVPKKGQACRGDSGSSLTCYFKSNRFQLGLVSKGAECGSGVGEDLYSDINSVTTRAWLISVTGGVQVLSLKTGIYWESPQEQCSRASTKNCCANSGHTITSVDNGFNPAKTVEFMYLTGQKVSASSSRVKGGSTPSKLAYATDGSASTMFHTKYYRQNAPDVNWFKVSLPDAVPEKNVIGFQIQNRRDCCQDRLISTRVYLIDDHENPREEIYCGSIGSEGRQMEVNFSLVGACAGPFTGKTLKLVGPTGSKNKFSNTPFDQSDYGWMNFNEIRLAYQEV